MYIYRICYSFIFPSSTIRMLLRKLMYFQLSLFGKKQAWLFRINYPKTYSTYNDTMKGKEVKIKPTLLLPFFRYIYLHLNSMQRETMQEIRFNLFSMENFEILALTPCVTYTCKLCYRGVVRNPG